MAKTIEIPEDFEGSLVFENMFLSTRVMAEKRGISEARMYNKIKEERDKDECEVYDCMGSFLANIVMPIKKIKKKPTETKIIKAEDIPRGFIY